MKPSVIAQVAHEINRAYCASLGDVSQAAWADAPEWQRQSALAGVAMHLANPAATPADSHISWLAEKTAAGWAFGPVKDAEKKEHPCCVPYDELPAEQKAKDYLFRAVVHQLQAIAPEAVPAASPPVPALPSGYELVTYIGRRDTFLDRLYGSNLAFTKGQTHAAPSELVRKLLRHADQFERPATPSQHAAMLVDAEQINDAEVQLAKTKAKKEQDAKTLDELQYLRDQVTRMAKPELQVIAKTRYGQDLDARASVQRMRDQVVNLMDRYGAV